MNQSDIRKLLESVRAGKLTPEGALERLKHLPFEDIGFAKVDHHRALRQGFAEVIFGKGKTPAQVGEIVRAMLRHKGSKHNVLVTRADRKIFAAVTRVSRAAKFYPLSGVISIERSREITGKGTIAVVAAGTSDIPVAEEAVLTAKLMGNRVAEIYDVGVAGIHRLLEHRPALAAARALRAAGTPGSISSPAAARCASTASRAMNSRMISEDPSKIRLIRMSRRSCSAGTPRSPRAAIEAAVS